jgi:hypothetical protein
VAVVEQPVLVEQEEMVVQVLIQVAVAVLAHKPQHRVALVVQV